MKQPLYGKYDYCINSWLSDCKRQASLPALFFLLQESGLKHADTYGFGWSEMQKYNCFWALYRINVRVEEYPKWQDAISIETWSKKPDTLLAHRDFDMFQQGRKILSATSDWLLLNNERKPQKISMIDKPLPLLDRKAFDKVMAKLPMHNLEKTSVSAVKTIPYSAMDINEHVNNTCYLQWVIDEFPASYVMNSEICEAEINYLQESLMGQQYRLLLEERLPDEYLCSVTRFPDGKDLARMILKFKRK